MYHVTNHTFDARSFYTINWILRPLWLVIAYDLSEYRRTPDITENCFLCFIHKVHSIKNVCKIIQDWASEGLKKGLAEAVYEQNKKKPRRKKKT